VQQAQHNKTEFSSIPSFDARSSDFDAALCVKAFNKFKVVHLRNVTGQQDELDKKEKNGIVLKWHDISKLYNDLNSDDQESWCIETKGDVDTSDILSASSTFKEHRAYCSFLVQKDKEMLDKTLNRLPISHFRWKEVSKWSYEEALWFFFGRNPLGNVNLDGRPEHTDSVTHDGTWHYQLSGVKSWFLRQTQELNESFSSKFSFSPDTEESRKHIFRVDCEEGDVIIINTKLWFHHTVIPPQECPSVSYARDFRFAQDISDASIENGMTNLDGLYATTCIEADTIIFREADLPDVELYTSEKPNCEVVELEDGTTALVSTRKINLGEFFCVLEESSEENDEDLSSE
jgi:hypothetical protein